MQQSKEKRKKEQGEKMSLEKNKLSLGLLRKSKKLFKKAHRAEFNFFGLKPSSSFSKRKKKLV